MMRTVMLGRTGPAVGLLGLGCMGMSPGVYGPVDEAESIATIHAAIEAGVTLIDTGDFYGMGHNEMLIRRALKELPRSSVIISVKFGGMRDPSGVFIGQDCRPVAVKNFLAYTRCGDSVPITSISTGRPASMRRCPLKTPSAPSPTWCAPAMSATSVCRRPAPKRSAARMTSIP